MTRRQPRFYFSLRSPYSWLAFHDLRERYPWLADRLTWVPFWEPGRTVLDLLEAAGGEFTYAQMSRPKHFYVLRDVRRLAAARQLDFRWPVDRDPCWDIPHLAWVVAARHGRGWQFLEHAYRSRWQDGADICSPDTVADLGEAIGLDGTALAAAAGDPVVRDEGVRALLAAYRDGVFGVPFFVSGADKYWGIDRLAAFVQSFSGDEAPVPAPNREPAFVPAARGADDGHAGGCG